MSDKTVKKMWIVRTSMNGYANRNFIELCVNEQPAQVVTWMNDRFLMPRSVEEYVWQKNERHESSSVTYPPGCTAKVWKDGIGAV